MYVCGHSYVLMDICLCVYVCAVMQLLINLSFSYICVYIKITQQRDSENDGSQVKMHILNNIILRV